MKITINNEEVLCDKNIKITEEMLNTSSTILNNVYPKTWETTHDYTQYYYPKDYSQCLIWTDKLRDANFNGYSSQDGTPTPTSPVPIKTITGSTNVNVIIGKNLLDSSNDNLDLKVRTTSQSYNNGFKITATGATGFSYCAIFLDNNLLGKTITVSMNASGSRTPVVKFYYRFNTSLGNQYGSTYNASNTITLTMPNSYPSGSNGMAIVFYVANITTLTNTDYATFENIQLEIGSTKTSYEPFKTTTYPLELGNIELCSVGKVYDTLYNDGENWYIYKAINKKVLNGQENWTTRGGGTSYAYQLSNFFDGSGCYGLCDYWLFNRNGASNSQANECIASVSTNTNVCIFTNNSSLNSVNNLKTWLSENKPSVYYQLAHPTTTQITDENLINQLNVLIKDLLFSGVAKRTGNISLNPFHAHYCDLQVLDYKTLLSEGDTLDYVIADKTVEEAIDMVIDSVKDYGFIKGNVSIPDNFKMGTYNTQEKTAYDVFQYISDITQTKWTTRVINQDTVAIDFYNPYDKTPVGTIDSTQQYFKDNNIIDITYNYSTEDYRNKQVMTSNEVVSSITQTFRVYADGVNKTFDIGQTIGDISYAYYTTSTDFVICDVITKAEQEQGYSGDIIYTPGETTFETDDKLANGVAITLEINLLVPGRQIALNEPEISRIATQNNRKGVISRYENRDDTKSSVELQRIAQSYIEYKGKAEITLTVQTQNVRLCEIGDIMIYNSSLSTLNDNYMCKKIDTEMIMTTGDIFYTFEFSNTYNTENAINYFDNQRNKTLGNISDGQTITRNLDIENTLDIVFFDTEVS